MKGYSTTGCCSGHPDRSEDINEIMIYVAFSTRYDFKVPFPEGSKYRKEGNMLCFDFPKGASKAELEAYQSASLDKLMAWAEALPNRNAQRYIEHE